MTEYKPPFNIRTVDLFEKSMFLAGSIEMGTAKDWQKEIVEFFKDDDGIILNPRRDNWDSSWEQKIDNPQFREQVEWELYGIENAAIVAMYFDPETKSPVTMLELGLALKNGNVLVCCPDGFFRKGNIEITCAYYRAPMYHDFEKFKEELRLIVGN